MHKQSFSSNVTKKAYFIRKGPREVQKLFF